MAYLIAVTISGSFRAFVAYSMGDDTAEGLGFMTLNPLVHVDFLGAFFLLFYHFGWGRHVPINPFKIIGRFRGLKIVLAYFSSTIAHLFMAIVVFMGLIMSFGLRIVRVAIPMIGNGNLSQSYFAFKYPASSSVAISLGLIGIAIIFLSTLLAVLDLIINSFHLAVSVVFEYEIAYNRYRDVLMILIPMLMIFFFIDPLRYFVIRLLLVLAQFFSTI